MLGETPSKAFNINSLLLASRQIVERSNELKMNHVISKKECQELYPHHDGVDGESFYGLIVQFRNRHFAEKLISLCDFDFSLAQQIGPLCHGNIFLLDRLCVLFSNDLSLALRFLNCFSSLPSSPFLLSSQFLSHFNNDVSSASSFLSRFNNDVSSASSFLSKFNNDGSFASSFLSHFKEDGSKAANALQQARAKFSEESSFDLALCGCNGDISAVEAFSALSRIKHLELLYDSELHPRTAEEFHSRCDDRGPTVSFFCSNGNCVCGVVNSSWISPPDGKFVFVSDSSAYLLRLSPNPRNFDDKFDTTDRALHCHFSFGPSFGNGGFRTYFSTNAKYPNGICGFVRSDKSFNLPLNDFLFPTTDGTSYPIDRIVVCKFIQ